MKGEPLPDSDHVVSYVKPTLFDEGVIDGEGFLLKSGHGGISVNWLECFSGDKDAQLAEVRRLKRLDWEKAGCLAEINVGQTKRHLARKIPDLSIVEDPLAADQQRYEADPSHSLICGLPHNPPERRQALQDMIAECVINKYATVV